MQNGSTRCIHIAIAMGLAAAAPAGLAQKMYRCSDGKGGTIFQQSPPWTFCC